MSDLFHIILEGAAYDIVKYIVGPLIVTAALTVILRNVFKKLETWREAITFIVGCFIAVCTLFYFVGATKHGPILIGAIQQAQGGPSNGGHDTVMIISMSIMNTGDMQSIVKDWRVDASIAGVHYNGIFEEMPNTFTFNNIPNGESNSPKSLTYKSEDNIVEKSITPIQPGAMLPGTLFVVFSNIEPATLRAAGADITVNFEDINSNHYSAASKISADIQPTGVVPGLHTQMVCPAPPGLLSPHNSSIQ